MIKVGMGWQISDMKDFAGGVQRSLEYYEKKFGRRPNVVECSKDLEVLPVIDRIRFHKIRIPKNILIVGIA